MLSGHEIYEQIKIIAKTGFSFLLVRYFMLNFHKIEKIFLAKFYLMNQRKHHQFIYLFRIEFNFY